MNHIDPDDLANLPAFRIAKSDQKHRKEIMEQIGMDEDYHFCYCCKKIYSSSELSRPKI